jgi:nucleoside-diphosphate-sugar epimerase
VVDAYHDIFLQVDKFRTGFYEYEIGSGETIKIKSLVQLLKELTNNKNTILSFGGLPYRKNEIMESKANIKKIKEGIGWQPQVALKEGLIKVIDWYKSHKESK